MMTSTGCGLVHRAVRHEIFIAREFVLFLKLPWQRNVMSLLKELWDFKVARAINITLLPELKTRDSFTKRRGIIFSARS